MGSRNAYLINETKNNIKEKIYKVKKSIIKLIKR